MATILVVDDLAANRAVLVALLRHQGHRLIEAADGREGLAAARAEHPGLVITDVLMPVMDGYEFVKQLRLDPTISGIPVVFYTAHYGEREARALALSSGVAYVITKPVESHEVLTIVGRVLLGESETGMPPEVAPLTTVYEGEHLRLLTDKLSEKTADLRTTNARLRALINIGLELGSERDPHRLLQRVCVAARDLFGATYVTLGILDRANRTVQRVVTDGADSAAWIKPGDAVSGILATVVAERRPFRGENPGGDPLRLRLPELHPEVQAFLIAPIASLAYVYGWICLVGNEGRTFTEDDEHLVVALAGQVGRIHENGYFYAVAQKRAEELQREILERKQAEDALRKSERLNRTLIEHLPHRIVVKDRHSVILFCNANYARDVSLPPEDVIGNDAFAFYPRQLAEAYHADDQEVMARGVVKNIEEPYRIGEQERWVHTVKVPYRDDQGQIIGVLVVFEDITERRTLEARSQQAQKMEAIGMLAGGVAHDFNNMLTAILGYSELLTEQIGPDKPIGQDLREIMAAARRAAALTRQLLAFSRRQVLAVVPVDITSVVRDLEGMLRRLLGEQITITTALADDLDPVMADVTQLEQLLVNLSVNARDAMPQGGSLTLATQNITLDAGYAAAHPGAHAGSYASLSVTDTGTGMSPDTQERIFEPFFTTKERGRGTGLGLAAVYGIVNQLRGYIEVSSQPAQGSTFTIYLPKTEQAAEHPIEPARVMSPVGTETILLVEDESGVRAFAKIALTRFGYRVIEADTAEVALALLDGVDTPIHLLLTDIVLPKMDGRELAVRVRRDRPDVRVLFMSGYASGLGTIDGLLEPGVHLLEKPFTAHALLTKTRQLLDTEESPPTQRA
jgi:PAS domain S-box-containing protein